MSTHRDYTDRRNWNWAKDKLPKEREREALKEPVCICWEAWAMQPYCPLHGDPTLLDRIHKEAHE